MFCNLNGKIINEKNATVSVNNRSFRYGDGCFETIKVVNGQIVLADYHTDRLFNSLQLLQFESPSYFTPTFIKQSILDLVNDVSIQNSRGRVLLDSKLTNNNVTITYTSARTAFRVHIQT